MMLIQVICCLARKSLNASQERKYMKESILESNNDLHKKKSRSNDRDFFIFDQQKLFTNFYI
jgi:hypothetical protein